MLTKLIMQLPTSPAKKLRRRLHGTRKFRTRWLARPLVMFVSSRIQVSPSYVARKKPPWQSMIRIMTVSMGIVRKRQSD